MTRMDNTRTIRVPRGTQLSAKSRLTEAPLRMLMNNLDPDVGERPHELVVYGGIGRAARDWESYDAIVATLRRLESDQTPLIQSGKPVGAQGIVQGTYETFVEMGRQHYGGNLEGKWLLTAGLGGMGGAQPLAAVMAGASCLAIDCARQNKLDLPGILR